jgi:large subunit ribosomal protein L9
MNVILLNDVRAIGKKYDVKTVNDGYARNFLFPNGLAEPATGDGLKKVEARHAAMEREKSESQKRSKEIARAIGATALEFELAVGKDGSVFGSVHKEGIQAALRDHGLVTKERADVELDHPIKTLGEQVVIVDLKNGVTAKLKIRIVGKGRNKEDRI